MATTEKPKDHGRSRELFDTSNDSEELTPRDATDEEIQDLPHIKGNVSVATWILIVVCASTNFARYGITALFRKCRTRAP